jgi:hypothetical protein
MLRIIALVLGVAAGCGVNGIAAPAAADLVPGGWLQPPSRPPEPEIPPPAMRPPPAPPPAPVSAPRKPPPRAAQPPSDGQVRF